MPKKHQRITRSELVAMAAILVFMTGWITAERYIKPWKPMRILHMVAPYPLVPKKFK